MNRNDLRRVDLNLLIVFETLMHERSVTRAAEKLFLGQPAISAALSRLRILFDDPLFVRSGRTMEPSARAVEIFALLTPALDSISTAVSRAAEFNPATSNAVFRIGLSDDVEFGLLPPLIKRLRAEAPGVVLVIRRRQRRVVLAVPQFNGLSTLLSGTDILATVPDYTAAALTAAGGLRSEDLPLDNQSFELHMAWRGAQDNDPAERWLRSRIQMFCGDPDSLT